ncbi:Gfo/Idh/MocA family oxidoreductase [Eubacteriales bacterium OttesenSCG-928-N13]|nr:Gfo/Idh/MocA family oxidoreductase [Eubacteriales bacterium OttesenSCG-928-N13]
MNIAMISKWHVHAEGYAQSLQAVPGCKVTAVWNEDEADGRKWAEALGCQYVPSLDDVLNDPQIDAVAINAPTSDHKDILIRAADAGKAIFTEKVLTLTKADALEVKQAIERNNTRFAISFPHKCFAPLQFAKKLLDDGKLGQVTYARVRNVHNGSIAGWLPPHFYDPKQCGGGAMIDLGAHPMYTLAWLLGRPKCVTSVFTNVTDHDVEDNAVCVLTFDDGAIGVSETGFVSTNNPYTLEISGTKGALMVHNGVFYCCDETNGEWVEAKDLPDELPAPVEQWGRAAQTGEALPEFDIDQAVLLSEIMEAAYKAHREGCVKEV